MQFSCWRTGGWVRCQRVGAVAKRRQSVRARRGDRGRAAASCAAMPKEKVYDARGRAREWARPWGSGGSGGGRGTRPGGGGAALPCHARLHPKHSSQPARRGLVELRAALARGPTGGCTDGWVEGKTENRPRRRRCLHSAERRDLLCALPSSVQARRCVTQWEPSRAALSRADITSLPTIARAGIQFVLLRCRRRKLLLWAG